MEPQQSQPRQAISCAHPASPTEGAGPATADRQTTLNASATSPQLPYTSHVSPTCATSRRSPAPDWPPPHAYANEDRQPASQNGQTPQQLAPASLTAPPRACPHGS